MSRTYPLMRGTAPLLVAVASDLFGAVGLSAWVGIRVVSAGILAHGGGVKPGQGKGIALALVNAVVIAGYTLIDGEGPPVGCAGAVLLMDLSSSPAARSPSGSSIRRELSSLSPRKIGGRALSAGSERSALTV